MAQDSLPPELLRMLMAISETGGPSEVDEPIRFSQRALSPMIARLQALLGDPLFEKTSAGTGLTKVGKFVLDVSRHALAVNDGILLSSDSMEDSPHVRVGMNSMLLDCFVGGIDDTEAENLSVTSATCSTIVKAFTEHKLDIAMVLDVKDHRSNLGNSLVAEFKIDFAWIGVRNFVLSLDTPVPLATWPADQFIFLDTLSKAGRSYRLCFTSPDYFSKFSAVRSGKCLAVVPRKAIVPPFVEVDASEYGLPAIEPKRVLLSVRGDPKSDRFRPVVSALSSLELISPGA